RALAFADQIDRAFSERESGAPVDGYYEEFVPSPPYTTIDSREGIQEGGRRRTGGRLASLRVRHVRAVPGGRPGAAGGRLSGRARADLRAQDDAAQGRAVGAGSLAPGRHVHGPGPLAQPVAVAVAL